MAANDIFNVENKVAIVTGASSGIGAHLAKVLANRGAFVVLAARREDKLAELSSEIGSRSRIVRCDVTNDKDLERLVEYTSSEFGRIDICINGAGISAPAPAELESADNFRSVLSANLISLFLLSQLVGREMLIAKSVSLTSSPSLRKEIPR